MPDYGHELQFGSILRLSTGDPQAVVDLARTSQRAGLDRVTFQDQPYQPRFLDTWTLLPYVTARTERVHLAPTVLNLPLRQPAVVARAAASLDLLSGGRFERLLNVDGTVATDGDGDGWPNSLSPMASRPTSWPPTTPTRWPARRGRRARRPAGGGRGAALSRRSGDERGDRMAPAPWS